jgi:hypothetical protein
MIVTEEDWSTASQIQHWLALETIPVLQESVD